jgi:hypothetical protein
VASGSSLSGVSGDKTKPSKGGYDYWIVWAIDPSMNHAIEITAQNASSAVVPGINDKTFTVYPNPVKGILYIQTNGKTSFSLTNQSGKVLLTKTITTEGEINVSSLASGMYFLKNSETGAVQKVVVLK